MVSTVGVNAQAEVSLKAELMGEIQIRFRTETFDLDRFADSSAIERLTRHGRPLVSAASSPKPEEPQ